MHKVSFTSNYASLNSRSNQREKRAEGLDQRKRSQCYQLKKWEQYAIKPTRGDWSIACILNLTKND